MRIPVSVCLAVALRLACGAGAAHAQQVSTNLNWDQCAADGRVVDRTFACNTNSGSETLVLSMVLHDSTRTAVIAWEARFDVTPVATTLPSWWGLGSGMCRPGALSLVTDWSGSTLPPTSCLPWYGASPASGGGAFVYGPPDRFSVRLVSAVPPGQEQALLAGQEYALIRIRISHSKTVGAGACAGCELPACLGVSQFDLVYPSPRATDYFAGAGLNSVTWQGGFVASYPTHSGAPCSEPSLCPYTNQLSCSFPPLPAHGRTWGMIKTMYH